LKISSYRISLSKAGIDMPYPNPYALRVYGLVTR
jgi:hypothetical protein